MTSTKWWIKITPTSPSSSTLAVQTNSVEFHTGNCPQGYTTPLKAETYAYISVAPPLPNRIRSDASQSSEYRGQIGPGDGLKVIDGPVCTDGYSWWLVESLDKRLRGWTIEGKSAQQWVIPCPNVDLQCSFIPTPTSSSLSSKVDKNKDQSENNCRSNKLAVGMYAEVDQDSLLVIRAEPHIGTILGHAGPMSIIRIVEGPSCAAGTVWWKVNAVGVGIVGWTTENYLEPCPKDNKCNLEPF